MKVLVDYNPTTGDVTLPEGTTFYAVLPTGLTLTPHNNDNTEGVSNSISDMIKLKNAGFTADEILMLRASYE